MDYDRAKAYLDERGQSHLLRYYDELSVEEREQLLADIEFTNFNIINNIEKQAEKKLGKITPLSSSVTVQEARRRKIQFEAVGLNMLAEGRVGAVLLAGGQGSRLGYDGPKGTFNIGVTRELTIFEQLMRNVFDVTSKTGRCFPLFIMTSTVNDGQTREFFRSRNYFGYPRDLIHFFIQDVAPACDYNGKVFLDEKHRVSLDRKSVV